MKKFKLYFDKDKEEKWLNEMSLQGWAMREFFFDMFLFVFMGLLYAIVAGFFLMSWRLTRKMHKLRQ